MFQTNHSTTVISSTDLKRHYRTVRELLRQKRMVIVTNRNSDEQVDGVFVPYSSKLIEALEDFLEDVEISANKETLDLELLESLQSGKGKRTALDNVEA